MAIKDRLIQYIMRGKDELSPEAKKAAEALEKVRAEGEKLTTALDDAKGAQGLAQTFKTTGAAADRAKSQWEAAEKRAADLRAALDRAPDTKGLTKGLKDAEKAADAARSELQSSEKDVEALRKELGKAPGDVGVATSLADAEEAAESARAELDAADKQVEALRTELDTAPGTKGLEQSLRAADREAAKAAKSFDELTAETKEAEAAAQAAGVDTRNLASEQDRLAREVDEAADAVKDNAQQLRELEREQRSVSKATEEHKSRVDAAKGAMDSAGKRVLAFAGAYISLNAAFGLVQKGLNLVRDGIRSMLETGNEFELMQQRLTGLMGSIEEGEKATAWISRFAKDTGQLIPEVTEAFALLKAYGLDPMDGSLQAITDKSVQLGGGMERLSGITAALGQMWAKQKIQQEEVLQLTERGVVVWPMLEKAMGKTTAQLQDMAQKGLLGRDAVKLLIDEIGKSADGAAAAGLDTLTGKMNGLRNAASEFMNRIAESGAMDAVKDRLSALADQIDRLDQDGTLDNLAQALSDAFVQGIEKVEEFAQSLRDVDFKTLIDESSAWLSTFGAKIDSTVRSAELLAVPFRVAANVVTAFISTALSGFSLLLSGSLLAMRGIAHLIPDMFGGKELREGLKRASDALSDFRSDAMGQIKQDLADLGATYKTVFGDAAAAAEDAHSRIAESGEKAFSDLGEVYRNNIISLGNALAAIDLTPTLDKLKGLEPALKKAFDTGHLNEAEWTQALEALSQRKADLGDVSEQTAIAVRKLTQAIDEEKDKQAEALAERLKGNISLEEFSRRHNESAEAIATLTKAIKDATNPQSELAIKVEALRAEQERVRAEFDAGSISLEEYARRHNEADDAIKELITTSEKATQSTGAHADKVRELKREQAELLEEYRKGNITLEEYQNRHNAIAGELSKLAGASKDAAQGIDEIIKSLKDYGDLQEAIKGAETDVDISKLGAAIRKMYAEGKLTADEYRKALVELEKQKEAVEKATGSQAKAEGELATAQEETVKALTRKEQMDKSAADAAERSIEVEGRRTAVIQEGIGMMIQGAQKWAYYEAQAAGAHHEEQRRVDSLIQGYSQAEISIASFIAQARQLRLSLAQDGEAFATLERAVASAESQMRSMADSTRSTLDSVRDELDRLRGDEEAIEKRRMESRRRDLQAQLAEARAAGNSQAASNLSQAISMLSTIEQETKKRAQGPATQATAPGAEGQDQAGATTTTGATAPAPAPAPPTTVIRLESAAGSAVNVAVPQGQEDALLSILEQSGLRTI